jgi:hypothetical protein
VILFLWEQYVDILLCHCLMALIANELWMRLIKLGQKFLTDNFLKL